MLVYLPIILLAAGAFGQECTVTTIGGSGTAGHANGVGAAAVLNAPSGIAFSTATGLAYFSDRNSNRLRSLSGSTFGLLAGSGTLGFSDNGIGSSALFNSPCGLAVDDLGSVYVADRGNCRVRRVSTTAPFATSTVAGSSCGWFDTSPPTSGQLLFPEALCVSQQAPASVLYISDTQNHRIRKVVLGATLSTIAGSSAGYGDGQGTSALFNAPRALACLADEALVVMDQGNKRMRYVSPSGAVSTLVGGASATWMDGYGGGAALSATLGFTLVLEASRIVLPDAGNNRLRALALNTVQNPLLSTLAGTNGVPGFADGGALSLATFSAPSGTSRMLSPGQYLIADTANNKIRQMVCPSASPSPTYSAGASARVTPSPTPQPTPSPSPSPAPACLVSLLAGSASGSGGWSDAVGTSALLSAPMALVMSSSNDGNLYFTDSGNHRVRRLALATGAVATLAGASAGFNDAVGASALFSSPHGLALAPPWAAATLYIGDRGNHRIRALLLANSAVVTLAGSGGPAWSDGVGVLASFFSPEGVAVRASDGMIFVADSQNFRVRSVTPGGRVATVAGNGASTSINGVGTEASFSAPRGILVSPSGTSLYVSESTGNRLREVDLRASPAAVTTLLGYTAGWMDGPQAQAAFNSPAHLSLSPWWGGSGDASSGGLLLADAGNHVLRQLTLSAGTSGSGVWSARTSLAGMVGSAGLTAGAGSSARFSSPMGLWASNWSGSVFVGDTSNNQIRVVVCPTQSPTPSPTPSLTPGASPSASASLSFTPTITPSPPPSASPAACMVTTVAGTGSASWVDGAALSSTFSSPQGLAWDGALAALFIADQNNNRVRRLLGGVVSTLAGGISAACTDGTGATARFWTPSDLVLDAAGMLYVADTNCHRVRRVTPAGVVTAFAGDGVAVSLDSAINPLLARFNSPVGLALSRASGVLYVSEVQRVRRISPTGAVSTLAGTGSAGYSDSAVGTLASFWGPRGLAVDASEQVYVADVANNRLRMISPSGSNPVSTLAGAGPAGGAGMYQDGIPGGLWGPTRLALLPDNRTLLFSDTSGHRLRALSLPTREVRTLAGTGVASWSDGAAAVATFNSPGGLAWSAAGILLADSGNHRLRQLVCPSMSPSPTPSPTPSAGASASPTLTPSNSPSPTPSPTPTLTSTGCTLLDFIGTANSAGNGDGTGVSSTLNGPEGLALHPQQAFIAFVDTAGCRVRRATLGGVVTTVAGGTCGFLDATGASAQFNAPSALVYDATAANLFVADTNNHRIRRIQTINGGVVTAAGSGAPGFLDGSGVAAQLNSPGGVTVGASGVLYFSDTGNHRVRQMTLAGVVTTLAGSGAAAFQDGFGTATSAFSSPRGIAVDGSAALLYIGDSGNNRIRRVVLATGHVTTLAGRGGAAGWADGQGSFAAFSAPYQLSWSNASSDGGELLVADSGNMRVRRLTGLLSGAARGGAFATTIAGTGVAATLAGQQLASLAPVFTPRGVVQSFGGEVYFSERSGHVVRRYTCPSSSPSPTPTAALSPGASPSTTSTACASASPSSTPSLSPSPAFSGCTLSAFVGSGGASFSDASGAAAAFNCPSGLTIDASSGSAFLADATNHRVRVISPAGVVTTLAGSSTAGFLEGTGAAARLNRPLDVAWDVTTGDLVVADSANHRLRRISPGGTTSTQAGSGSPSWADGVGAAAAFNTPSGVAVDAAGWAFVADTNNHRVRSVSPPPEIWLLPWRGPLHFTLMAWGAVRTLMPPWECSWPPHRRCCGLQTHKTTAFVPFPCPRERWGPWLATAAAAGGMAWGMRPPFPYPAGWPGMARWAMCLWQMALGTACARSTQARVGFQLWRGLALPPPSMALPCRPLSTTLRAWPSTQCRVPSPQGMFLLQSAAAT